MPGVKNVGRSKCTGTGHSKILFTTKPNLSSRNLFTWFSDCFEEAIIALQRKETNQ
jgi:hypothetical protein